jgi:hypothetical protein
MWTIDKVCQLTTNPELLAALHACRDGHPLNHPMAWENAYSLAAQAPSYSFDGAALEWLQQMAYDHLH